VALLAAIGKGEEDFLKARTTEKLDDKYDWNQ
jgi:hypothetical protein